MGSTINRISAYARILLTSFVLASLVLPQFNPDYTAGKIHEEITDSEWSFEPSETDTADGNPVQGRARHGGERNPASTKTALHDHRSAIGFLSSRSPTGPPTLRL